LLLGIYPSILDTDNSLILPDEIQKEYKDGLYIARGFDRNIMVLTVQAFEVIYDRITKLNLADPVARMLLRLILSTAHQAELTSEGKIQIPEALKRFANLMHEVMLIGQGDFMELWSPEFWHNQEEQLLNVDANHFSTLNITTR